MDATGSMSSLLKKTANGLGTIFERAKTLLQENDFNPKCFELQCAVYRDYDVGLSEIL
jgi:hypothetical protein